MTVPSPEGATTLGERIARNAAAAFGGQTTIALLGLVATAVIVRGLGTAGFGTWSLVMALVGHAALMDLGLGVALVRRVADTEQRGDREASVDALGAALMMTAALALVTAAGLWLVAEPAAGWLRVPVELRPAFIAAVRIAGVGAALALPGSALGAVPAAVQQLARLVMLEVIITAGVIAAQCLIILLDGGLDALAWAFAAGRLLSLAGRWVIARRLLGYVKVGAAAGYPFWTSLGRFGVLKVVHQLLSQMVLYLDRLLVGALVSVEAVAWYTVAMELAQRLLMIQSNVAQAYYPAACAAVSDHASFGRLYLRSARAVAMLTFPVALVLAVLAEPLLVWWVGPDFAAAAPLLQLVALAYAVMALTAIPAAAADALNQPGLSVRYGVVSVALNLTLALILIPRLGARGAAVAIALVVLIQTPPFVRTVTRMASASVADYLRRVVLQPLLPAVLLALAVLGAWLLTAGLAGARLPLTVAIGMAAFFVVSRAAVRLDAEERAFIAGMPGGALLGRIMGRA